jgi:hypothetical protein
MFRSISGTIKSCNSIKWCLLRHHTARGSAQGDPVALGTSHSGRCRPQLTTKVSRNARTSYLPEFFHPKSWFKIEGVA